jgi:hypothetical protein
MYKFFLDDIRDPPDNDWVVARSVSEAIDKLKIMGTPDEMSLDHDLGENVPTGYDFVVWLCEGTGQKYFPKDHIKIHSANPVGRGRMEAAIRNFLERNSEDGRS